MRLSCDLRAAICFYSTQCLSLCPIQPQTRESIGTLALRLEELGRSLQGLPIRALSGTARAGPLSADRAFSEKGANSPR
jgi:hypothetical protein